MLNRAGTRVAIGFTFLAAIEGVAAADCPESAVRWASSSNRLYISGPRLRLPQISRRLYRSVPTFVKPDSGEVSVLVPASETAAPNKIRVYTFTGPVNTSFTVGQLVPNASYRVKRNGVSWINVTSNAQGVVTFSDVLPDSASGTALHIMQYEVLP